MTVRGFDEERQADLLDLAIENLLKGKAPQAPDDLSDVLQHLLVLHQAPVPDELYDRPFEAEPLPESLRAQRFAAPPATAGSLTLRSLSAAFGTLMLFQAATFLLAGESFARFLGFAFDPHLFGEHGLTSLALGTGFLLAAWQPRFLSGAVAFGLPLGVVLGLYGLYELPHSPVPGAELFHLVQACVGVSMGVIWWRGRGKR